MTTSIPVGFLAAIMEDAPTLEYVLEMAVAGFNVTREEMTGPSRRHPLVKYRQITMAAVRDLTKISYPLIGKAFGGRDHTTAMHACAAVRCAPSMKRSLDALKAEVRLHWDIDHGFDAGEAPPPPPQWTGIKLAVEFA